MASNTVVLGNRVDPMLKRYFDETCKDIGLTPTAALTVFMKRFVAEGGFPFEVRRRLPTEEEFAAEMEARFQLMLAGHATEHDLIEV